MRVQLRRHPQDLPLFTLPTLRLWWPSQLASGWTGATPRPGAWPASDPWCQSLACPSEPQFPHLADGQWSSRGATRRGVGWAAARSPVTSAGAGPAAAPRPPSPAPSCTHHRPPGGSTPTRELGPSARSTRAARPGPGSWGVEAGGGLWHSPSQREGGEAQPLLVLQMGTVALGPRGLTPSLAFPTQAEGSGASGQPGQGGLPPHQPCPP